MYRVQKTPEQTYKLTLCIDYRYNIVNCSTTDGEREQYFD